MEGKFNMISYKKIRIGQIYTIGKKTQRAVKEINNLNFEIGNQVEIITYPQYGLFTVRDIETGFKFDVDNKMIGKLIRDIEKF